MNTSVLLGFGVLICFIFFLINLITGVANFLENDNNKNIPMGTLFLLALNSVSFLFLAIIIGSLREIK